MPIIRFLEYQGKCTDFALMIYTVMNNNKSTITIQYNNKNTVQYENNNTITRIQ